jgi:hypothetical protein
MRRNSDGRICRSGLRHPFQHRAEPNAALADQRGRGSHRAPFAVGTGKADADLVAAEQQPCALARRVLVINQLALPFAVGASVGVP